MKVERQSTHTHRGHQKIIPLTQTHTCAAHAEQEGGLREKVAEEWAGKMRGLQMDVERGEATEQWNPHAHGEEGACNFTQHLSAVQHVFVSCAVSHFQKLTQSVRAPFYPFSQDGHIQQRSRSLCEHQHVPMSGTLKFVNTH